MCHFVAVVLSHVQLFFLTVDLTRYRRLLIVKRTIPWQYSYTPVRSLRSTQAARAPSPGWMLSLCCSSKAALHTLPQLSNTTTDVSQAGSRNPNVPVFLIPVVELEKSVVHQVKTGSPNPIPPALVCLMFQLFTITL